MFASDVLWLVINLDGSEDRLTWMTRQLEAHGIEFARSQAIDGKALRTWPSSIDPALFRRCFGRELRPADAACYLSHLSAMNQFLATDCSYAVIMEDDLTLSADASRVVSRLTAPGAPDDWDMVKLTGNNTLRSISLRRIDGDYKLGVAWTRLPGAAAYLVNRKAAQHYIDTMLPMEVLFDHAFDRGWALGLRTRVVVPLPASGTASIHSQKSTIETRPRLKVRWWRKAPTLWWRMKNEVMRVLYALQACIDAQRSRIRNARTRWIGRPSVSRLARASLFLLLSPIVAGAVYFGVLRLDGNFHTVVAGELYRSAQPTPGQIDAYVKTYGIRTIINLRGPNSGRTWYDGEVREASKLNVDHFDFPMSARSELSKKQVENLIALFEMSKKPILVHCLDGADRTGLASALYLASVSKQDEDAAEDQLSMKYGHFSIPWLAIYAMDRTLEKIEPWLGYTKS
jgi:GR25 family glycosyltransferase involved in LPS biosynthesis/protein tyrosine/serine phosphatase